jgi:hypothetical protein
VVLEVAVELQVKVELAELQELQEKPVAVQLDLVVQEAEQEEDLHLFPAAHIRPLNLFLLELVEQEEHLAGTQEQQVELDLYILLLQ